MKVLVTGASGFIASAIVEVLLTRGDSVLACAHSKSNIPDSRNVEFHQVDFLRFCNEENWIPLLNDVDAVINCAGILRASETHDFDTVHYLAPKALADACIKRSVSTFIQISALGNAADGLFISSKHKLDRYLLETPLKAFVIRPSVVVSTRGSYGGTSLLRALAALPFLVFVPGLGDQRIQPILLEDLADIVGSTFRLCKNADEPIYAVGPEVITIREFLLSLRSWLKLPGARVINTPAFFVSAGAWLGERLGAGPLGNTMNAMLERGNVGPTGSFERLVEMTGFTPRSVTQTLNNTASFVQDRWHARLYLLAPLIWLTLCTVWIMSGISGFTASSEDYRAILQKMWIQEGYQGPLVLATSVIDIALGLALLFRFHVRSVLLLMLVSSIAYTASISFFVPSLWLDPLGLLLKNLAVITLIGVYLALVDAR